MSALRQLLATPTAYSRRTRLLVTAAAALIYLVTLLPLTQRAGSGAAILVVVPVFIAAWFCGRWGGLLLSIILPLVVVALLALSHTPGLSELIHGGGVRAIVLLLIGLVIGWLSELTGQLRANEAALAASEGRLRALVQHAADGIAIVDARGTTIYESPAAARLLGFTPEEALHSDVFGRIHPDDATQARQLFAEILREPGCLRSCNLQVQHADGSWRVLEIRASNLLADPTINGIVVNYRDITARQSTEMALKQSAESFTSLFEATGEGLIIHEGGPILAANRTYAAMMGYEVADVVGRDGLDFLVPETRALSASLSQAGDERPYLAALICRDGTHLPVELAGKAIRYLGRPARLVTLRDITARQAAETALRESEAGLAESQRIAHLGSWAWDIAADRVIWSAELHRIFDLAPDQYEPSFAGYLARVHPDDRARARAAIEGAYQNGTGFDSEHRIVRPDGVVRTLHSRGLAIRDAAGQVIRMVGTCHDVTERKALEARLAHQATHDPLTGLPNRALFHDRLGQALARARRDGDSCAVLFLDLDRFKEVNDSLGHAVGDKLLVAVADRLRGILREADTLARLGGDEFALLLEEVTDLGEALRVVKRLQEALADPFEVDGRTLFAAASIGVALRTLVEDGPEELLRYADVALYRAKEVGGNCAEAFYPGMNAQALSRLELEHDLRRALERGELRVHYQPKVDLTTGAITAMEALARWQHPTRGLVPPGDFIPLAEETGLIVPIGRWVLTEACRQLCAWQAAYPALPAPRMAVNLSARQFRHPDLVEDVAATLADYGIFPGQLTLEVTETATMERSEGGIATLSALRALGVSLAIDDFGTGYSSLAYLQRLPVDTLKIDRDFFHEGARNRDIVRAVADLAHGLGLDVVAEGLETAEQVALARETGCDRGQGYYFAPALPAEELEALWTVGLICDLPGLALAGDEASPVPALHHDGSLIAAH